MPSFPPSQIKFRAQCAAAFRAAVLDALNALQLVTCGNGSCEHCARHDYGVLSHYSRNGLINGWELGFDGKQECWSEWVTDSEVDLEWITDQPCRPYQQLCLIKVSNCPGLRLGRVAGKNTTFSRLWFAAPCWLIAKLDLAGPGAPGAREPLIANQVASCPPGVSV